MSSLYDLISVAGGYQFTNQAGDKYTVYLTEYSLLNPHRPNEEAYIDVYMLGFSCKRFDPKRRQRFDAKSKATILSIFKSFLNQHPDRAFIYICDNHDGFARNRRITFGRWFLEVNTEYEQHYSAVSYKKYNWYSAILIKISNDSKKLYIDAYHYTLKQMSRE